MLQLISLSAVRAEGELMRGKAPPAGVALLAGLDTAGEPAAAESAHVAALLEWTQAVCAHYGLPVRSFGACFKDGSVFCLLVRLAGGTADLLTCAACQQPALRGWQDAVTQALGHHQPCQALFLPLPHIQVHHYLGHAYVALKDVYRPAAAAAAAAADPVGDTAAPDAAAVWAAGGAAAEGARRNFALLQGVVTSLGGIPAMVSGEWGAGLRP